MILDLPAGLLVLLPDPLSEAGRLSIVKVQTTRALYLVFSPVQACPLCVVQFGTEENLRFLHGILQDLHMALPATIFRSLACARWHGELWVHVQSGLAGLPWSSMPRRLRTLDRWLELRGQALTTLGKLQAAVRGNSRWRSSLHPSAELLRQLEVARGQGSQLSAALMDGVHEAARELEQLPPGEYPWQHGDYCFNNLMVSRERLGLIDSEEFGGTSVPLHDELSLGFSADEFMKDLPGAPPLHAQISECTQGGSGKPAFTIAQLRALLYHHLLWRLNQCLTRKRRRDTADMLLGHLHALASSPTLYLQGGQHTDSTSSRTGGAA